MDERERDRFVLTVLPDEPQPFLAGNPAARPSPAEWPQQLQTAAVGVS